MKKRNLLADFVIKWLFESCSPDPEKFVSMSVRNLYDDYDGIMTQDGGMETKRNTEALSDGHD